MKTTVMSKGLPSLVWVKDMYLCWLHVVQSFQRPVPIKAGLQPFTGPQQTPKVTEVGGV